MTDGISLGSATLGLEANLAQLRADLDDAKARVAVAVAEMQAELDRLHVGLDGGLLGAGLDSHAGAIGLWSAAQDAEMASVRRSAAETTAAYAEMAAGAEVAADIQVAASDRVVAAYAAQAIAAKAAADAEEAAAGRSALARSILGGIGGHGAIRDVAAASSDTAIWGVRGPTPHPFSATNPGTVVIAAADRTPLGSLAAAIGEDAQSGGPEGVSVSTQRGNTTTVVGSTPLAEQQRQKGAVPALIGLDAQRQQVMEGSLARALTALEAAQRPSAGKATTIAGITEEDQKVADATGSAVADALAVEAAKALPANLAPGQVAKGGSAYRAAYEALGYTVASRVAGGPGRLYAPGGEPGTGNYGLTAEAALLAAQKAEDAKAEADALAAFLGHPYGAGAVGIPGLGPRSGLSALGPDMAAAQAALYEPEKAAAATGAAGGSGGGGGVPPWLAALLWGHGGGGGGGGGTYGLGLAGRAFGGAMGIGAGIGSLGSFAGFGPEHIILTAGGIAGSGVAALGGGALLGAGALGKVAAGGGADALVGASAIADTKTLYTAYEKLREAVAEYGKGSEQADEAQKELNATMKGTLSGTPGVTAELHLAEKLSALNVQWDKQTSSARVAFVKLAEPLVEIGSKWIPLINRAATENFTSMRKSLQPFFEYLGGPEAMGIFEKLEGEFHEQIPTAMKLLDMSFQFLGKTIAAVAPLTGSLLTSLDNFFTKMDEPQHFAKWEEMMSHLIKDFHVWGAFIKELGGALVDLFDKDAHTGEGIIETLTQMLHGVREWEKSVTGSTQLKTIFTVHKEEVIALLGALSELVAPFEEIYMTLSPPLVRAVTTITEAVAKMLSAFESLGSGATWVVGIGLILAKLKLLVPLLKQAGEATGILSGEVAGSTKVADLTVAQSQKLGLVPVASKGAAAEGAVAEEGLTGAVLTDALASTKASLSAAVPDLIKGGLAALVTSMVASALGAHGTTNTAASLGVGVGVTGSTLFGPEVGIPAGLATAGLIEALHALNKKAPEYGEQFAKAYYAPFAVLLPKTVTEPLEEKLKKIRDEREKAEHPGEPLGSLTHAEEKIPLYGKLFTAGPSPETAKIMKDQEKEGANAFAAFKQGFRDSTQKSAFGFSLSAFQSLFDMSPVARQAAAKSMLAWAAELVKNKELPVNALGEIIHRLERYFPELTAFFQTQGAASSKALTTALNLQQAQTNTQHALKVIDEAFGTAKLTIPQALESIDYAIAHSAGKEKHLWEEKRYAVQHALFEEEKALKASTAAQLESMHHLASGLKTGATSWETYAVAVEHWAKKLTERVSGGIESLGQGIKTINAMLETELSELGAPKEIRTALATGKGGVNLRENPTTETVGKGPLRQAQGGLLQIGQPGDAGHDTVGLNVGGLPIAVGAGEQVAVFNRHQQPIVNAALEHMGYGGLPGLFGAVTTPNYMAAGGLIPDVVQAGLSDVRKAGKAKLASTHSTSTHGGGKLGGASYSGSWVQVMHGIAKEEGWSLPAWEGVIADESGGIVSNQNPTSTAFGLGQLESMNWPTYGGGPGSSGVEQIIAMARYIKATYGNPTNALAHEGRYHWYGRGGLLSFASGGLVGSRNLAPGYDMNEHAQFLKEWVKYEALLDKDKAFGPFGVWPKAPVEWQNPNRVKVYMPNGEEIEGLYQGSATQYGNPREPSDGIWNRLREWAHTRNHPAPEAMASGGLLGFAGGGIVPGFAAGGHFSTGSGRKKAKPLPKPVDAWKVHPFKQIHPLSTTWWGQGFYDQLNAQLGETGQVAKTTEEYELSSNAAELALQAAPHGGEFIYTPGTQGNTPGVPEILTGNVELRQRQLEGLIGTENSLLGDLNTAWGLSSTVLRAAEEGSRERAKAILSLKAKIKANLAKIKQLHEHRHALEVKLSKVRTGKKATAADHAEAKKLGGEIHSTAQQIQSLEAENVQLGGNATSIGNAGKIGTLDTQVSELNAAKETVKGDQHTLGGLTEHGGSMLTAQLTLQKLAAELTAIGGPELQTKLAEAKEALGGTGESPLELKERELAQTEEKLKISKQETLINQQALSVFGGPGDLGLGGKNAYVAAGARGMLIPASWIPSFDVGGVVPGARGAPTLAVLHGEEEVLTPEQRERGGSHFHQHNHIETLTPADPDMLLAIGRAATRGQRLQGSRQSKRLAPGV